MKKISIIILLCLIMSITVSCGKDNDVKDTHNTSNNNLNSEIENLNSQVSELQSQINELTSDPYNETVDEMYYEFELDGEMYVTKGSSYCTEIAEIKMFSPSTYNIKSIEGKIFFLSLYPPGQNLNFNSIITFKASIKDKNTWEDMKVVFKKINGNEYLFLNLNDLNKVRALGWI